MASSLSMPPQLSPVKQEPQVKQEATAQPSSFYPHHQHHQHQQHQHQHQHPGSTYSSAQHYGQHQPYSSASFQSLPSTANYGLPRHLLSMNMQQPHLPSSSSSSSTSSTVATASGLHSAATSNAATPILSNAHLNTSNNNNNLSSAPSSPSLTNLQHQGNNNNNSNANSHFSSNVNSNSNSGSNSPYLQHQSYAQPPYQSQQQQQHAYQHQTSHSSDYNFSPPYGSQQQQGSQQQHHGVSGGNGNGNGSGNGGPTHVQFTSSTAPSPMRQHQSSQYSPLVPPLSETQYAQYHQLLGSSAFSSAQTTPYHSNHSTPYSSMPGSPTHEYQQLSESQLAQKPKRRQVKNACVNCQKACKKCDEGRPCARCVKYGLTDTCVDSTRKVRKKGIKRGPYKRRPPPSQIGSASASTTPTMRNAVPSGVPGYMSEPVTTLNSPTQSHMLPFTSTAGSATMGHMSASLDFGYDTSGGPGGYSFHSQRLESSYAPSYATSYSGSNLYAPAYSMNSNSGNTNSSNMS